MENKYHIILKDKVTGEICELYNDIFNSDNGVAFWQIDKNWELVSAKQFVGKYKKVDYYEGDKVLVKGTKKIGAYETEIIRDSQGWTLKENKTYLNNDKCFTAIIEKL